MSSKSILVFDGTLLANEFSRSNSDRTGVFFVVYNLFLQFTQQNIFELLVYSDFDRKEDVKKAIELYGFSDLKVITSDELKNYNISIFFEPGLVTNAPKSIKTDISISKYSILYDITPLALPDIESPNKFWFDQLANSLTKNEYYFCISDYTKKDFLRFFPILNRNNMTVTPLAASSIFYRCIDKKLINDIKRKYNIPIDKSYIFSLCTLQPRKNLIHAVKTFVEYIKTENIKDLYFVLGGGHWEAFIDLLDKEINLQGEWKDHIIKTGYIDDKDLAPLYSDALCTVYVSLYEGFGLPILEAMQCGCPVITSNTTSCAEVIGNCGITVDPLDSIELKAAFRKMLKDANFRTNCTNVGLERAKTFSWKKCANIMFDTIQKTYRIKQNNNFLPKKKIFFGIEKKTNKCTLRFFYLPLVQKIYFPEKNLTTLYILKIPFITKHFGSTCDKIKLLGLPIIKIIHEGFEVHKKVCGLTVYHRANYKNIINYTEQLTNAIVQAIDANKNFVQRTNDFSLNKELEKMDFYSQIKKINEGEITLEDELKAIELLADKLLKEEA